jgi:hypothetical protein
MTRQPLKIKMPEDVHVRLYIVQPSRGRMKRLVLLVLTFAALIAAAIPLSAARNQNSWRASPMMDAEKWHEDLAIFREQMPKIHGDLFHTMTPQQFNDAIDALEESLPGLDSNQVKVGILRLVAMVHDGHTRVRQETLGNHMLPVQLYFFAEGLYVEAAARQYASLVGGRVKRIGAMSPEDVYGAVRQLIPIDGDNEYRRKLLAPDLMVDPEVLQAIGAAASAESVPLTVEKDGREITVGLPAGPFRPWNNHGWPKHPEGWVDAAEHGEPVPLWLQHSDRNYWHTYLDDGKTLYIQYNEVEDESGGEPISKYFPTLLSEAERKRVDKVILDLRLNGGGNNYLNRPIWHALLKSERLNQKGMLWVIIGPKTFSAATSCVDEFELNTNAIFAGEPTGESPNQWGDPTDLKLPNSGIVIQASTLWWQLEDPRDHRSYRKPDLPVPLTFADYAKGIDPVMQAIEHISENTAAHIDNKPK